ncbi:hypothetical protein THAOC_37255 [Thalassiosira oceanica]|uniref:Uncharacterized protein n=1 Tax=Thalassiosira oceanica TaxID=159749 RepID=K0R0H3_THAOC|nr:hypothetical protein THAOC_37255 [Thalassiosira oceanica]|eukprot:EJK44224.1 hypothetical protein THAOC_37255 [Thalassiosira oceanica]
MSLDPDHEHRDEDNSVSSYYTYDSFESGPHDPHGFREEDMWDYSPQRDDYDDPERSENVLFRVERNSPAVDQLSVYSPPRGEDWIRVGRAVSQSTNIIVFRVYAADEANRMMTTPSEQLRSKMLSTLD